MVVSLLKIYLIAGELFLAWCLSKNGRVVAEFKQVGSFPVVVLIVIVSIATWPMAFVLGRLR